MRVLLRIIFLCLLVVGESGAAGAAGVAPGKQIPEELKGWESWATWRDEHRYCPAPAKEPNKHFCVWPSHLALKLESQSGRFDLGVTVFHPTLVALPGDGEVWPQEVKVDGAVVPVVEKDGRPVIRVLAGNHILEGTYRWEKQPQRLRIPQEVGVLMLVLDGKKVEVPAWDADGWLWLSRKSAEKPQEPTVVEDSLKVTVAGMIEDGVPLYLNTEVGLEVTGKSREVDLGSVVPAGWKVLSVEAPIPVALDELGRMRVQVRTGSWKIALRAFRLDRPTAFAYGAEAKPAVSEQMMAFMSDAGFRTVEIKGAEAVDPTQVVVPPEWASLPNYRWSTAVPFEMAERMRGMGDQKAAGLSISREWWLDENGSGLTFRDTIRGGGQSIWRLDAGPGQELGAVRSISMSDVTSPGRLLTLNPQTKATGVEVRSRSIELQAVGRFALAPTLPATGWQVDADSLQVALNLPPGWRLLALFGSDWVEGDWLTAWSMYDLFLLLFFSLAVFRLWGFWAGLLAFVAFGLSYHEPDAPRFMWLVLLVPVALVRLVPKGRVRNFLKGVKWLAAAGLVLVLAPFVGTQVQQALYPQLESTAAFPTSGRMQEPPEFVAQSGLVSGGSDKLQRKLNSIIIPKLDLREMTIQESVDHLREQSRQRDPEGRGVNIVLKLPDVPQSQPGIPGLSGMQIPGLASQPGVPPSGNPADARLTLGLDNIPLSEALKYVTQLANLKYKLEGDVVLIVPISTPTDVLVTKEYKVRPDFFKSSGGGVWRSESPKEFLLQSGVPFLPGASATFSPATGRMVVRNTQENLDLVDVLQEAGGGGIAPPENLLEDPKARIQTGPAVPQWSWRQVRFGWNGPVVASQQVRPILISLSVERALTVLRVLLLLGLTAVVLGVLGVLGAGRGRSGGRATSALLLAGFVMLSGTDARAEIPSQQMLDTLRERLLETGREYPVAADISSATLTLKEGRISLESEIHVMALCGVPLPGRVPDWSPLSVTVDGKPEVALRREDGYLWVVLTEGVHRVKMEAMLGNTSKWQWTYSLKPHRVKIEAPGWKVSGVSPDGVPENQVFFEQEGKAQAVEAVEAPAASGYELKGLQNLVLVERKVELGLLWKVHTTVSRISTGNAISQRIPLLAGEQVLSSEASVKDGFVEVRLAANDTTYSWESRLPITPELVLSTNAGDAWVERWQLDVATTWSVKLSALAYSQESGFAPLWRPWPGESVQIVVSRPQAVAGATLTVQKVAQTMTVGRRQRETELKLSLVSSMAEDFPLELPAGAEVLALQLDARVIPVRKEGAKLLIPLTTGDQTVQVNWKIAGELGNHARLDALRLPVKSANVSIGLNLPEDRWVLWVDGPQRGPAIRFWGILGFSLLAAWILSRMARSPMGAFSWMLLAIGLTQVPLLAALLVVAWLFFLGWRAAPSFQEFGRFSYNFHQLLFMALTLGAVGVLLTAVSAGLLGSPEMFISGNGSTRTAMSWYQDWAETALPTPGVVAVSIWWYRLLMLIWALWLASSLLQWLHRAWQSFGSGGYFRSLRKPKIETAG